MTSTTSDEPDLSVDKKDLRVCGIVMPIAAMGEAYPAEHWKRVLQILKRAIKLAGMRAQLVWENADLDIIQSKILQNIYENHVVICDVSGLNPNVMFEAGLRMSTRLPTVIVTDGSAKAPFDISAVEYLPYPKSLEFLETDKFITDLAEKIRAVDKAQIAGTYRSYVANYKFETVTPTTVSITSEQYLAEMLAEVRAGIGRLERQHDVGSSLGPLASHMAGTGRKSGTQLPNSGGNRVFIDAKLGIKAAAQIVDELSRFDLTASVTYLSEPRAGLEIIYPDSWSEDNINRIVSHAYALMDLYS